MVTQPETREPPKLLTVEEAAGELRLSRSRLYSLIRTREVHSIKLGGRRFVPRVEIERIHAGG